MPTGIYKHYRHQGFQKGNKNPMKNSEISKKVSDKLLGRKQTKETVEKRAKKLRGRQYVVVPRKIVSCKNCGKEFIIIVTEDKKYCSRKCFKISMKNNTNGFKTGHKSWLGKKRENVCGDNHFRWKGGGELYYGPNWRKISSEILQQVEYKSEISGINYKKMDVHHIYNYRKSIQKILELCYKPYIKNISLKSLKFIGWNIIPNVIFDELNKRNDLFVLTMQEHQKYEDMPSTFFDGVRREMLE